MSEEANNRKPEAKRRLAPVSGISAVIKVHQTMPARELLEILNDPKRAANSAKLGWDIDEARRECEKSIAIEQAANSY